jgi:plasmid stabilization system protein ParE
MIMNAHWDPKAKDSLREIARYVSVKFGTKARQDFLQKVKDTEMLLRQSPNVGKIDSLFENRPETYRSVIINGLNKMVYRIDGNTIYIVAFWDTRKEPKGQASQVK